MKRGTPNTSTSKQPSPKLRLFRKDPPHDLSTPLRLLLRSLGLLRPAPRPLPLLSQPRSRRPATMLLSQLDQLRRCGLSKRIRSASAVRAFCALNSSVPVRRRVYKLNRQIAGNSPQGKFPCWVFPVSISLMQCGSLRPFRAERRRVCLAMLNKTEKPPMPAAGSAVRLGLRRGM